MSRAVPLGIRPSLRRIARTVYGILHSAQPRARGLEREDAGTNDPNNLVTLCGAHHRAAHRGDLLVEHTPNGPIFRHTDGSDYGHVLRPAAADTYAKTLSALRGLGFRETEVRAVLSQLRQEEPFRDAALDPLLRAALDRLTPRRRAAP